jgi:hypothetical protein
LSEVTASPGAMRIVFSSCLLNRVSAQVDSRRFLVPGERVDQQDIVTFDSSLPESPCLASAHSLLSFFARGDVVHKAVPAPALACLNSVEP